MAVKRGKLGGELQMGHAVCWRLCQESFFSEAVDMFNSIDDYTKGYRVRLFMSAYVSCVSGFSYMMYIDLNCCDSRI
jgi:hypothetical protein